MQSDLILIDSHFHEPICLFPSINAGCNASDLKERIEKYGSNKEILFAAAMGPWETKDRNQKEIDKQFEILKENINKYNPRFLGEMGLDYYWKDYGPKEIQKNLFIKQLELADSLGKRVLIHSRESSDDTCDILKHFSPKRSGVIHCFDGSENLLYTALDLGFWISFAGNLTYKSNDKLREILKKIPKDKLLLETDAPYLSPVPLRGKPNTSENIIYTYQVASSVLNIPIEELAALIYSNFRTFCAV